MDGYAAFIFDLDGVLVDSATYHYLAWRRLARELGFELSPADNERLKGVSRMACVDMLLSLGGLEATWAEKEELARRKNAWYVESIAGMDESSALPGARAFVAAAREAGFATALASASKNAPAILESTGLARLFDAIADGNSEARPKPAPDIFLRAAEALAAEPRRCVVFEDAAAGVEGALAAGMAVVGLGDPLALGRADLVLPGLAGLDPRELAARLGRSSRGRGSGI